jgi:hypothetical protein
MKESKGECRYNKQGVGNSSQSSMVVSKLFDLRRTQALPPNPPRPAIGKANGVALPAKKYRMASPTDFNSTCAKECNTTWL